VRLAHQDFLIPASAMGLAFDGAGRLGAKTEAVQASG